MPRTQKREHFVMKTKKPHKCIRCGGEIPVGSKAEYFNSFTGDRDYVHFTHPECEHEFEKRSKNHDQS